MRKRRRAYKRSFRNRPEMLREVLEKKAKGLFAQHYNKCIEMHILYGEKAVRIGSRLINITAGNLHTAIVVPYAKKIPSE